MYQADGSRNLNQNRLGPPVKGENRSSSEWLPSVAGYPVLWVAQVQHRRVAVLFLLTFSGFMHI